MEMESIRAYSPDIVYGQLTSPFTPKQITINAHTPYGKVSEEESQVFSREHFAARPQARMLYELPDYDDYFYGIKYENKQAAAEKFEEEKDVSMPEVAGFSASSASSKDIVQNSLKNGYSPAEAIAIRDARNAYKNSATLTKDPISALSSRSFRVF